jgi:hypothetical protein
MATPTASSTGATPRTIRDDSILDAIHSSHEGAVEMTRKWVHSIGEIVPELWNGRIVEGAPALHDLTDAAFTLTRRVLDAQYEFTKRIVDSVLDEVKKFD